MASTTPPLDSGADAGSRAAGPLGHREGGRAVRIPLARPSRPEPDPDAVPDAVPDAGRQAVPDAGREAVPDAGREAVPDAGREADVGATPEPRIGADEAVEARTDTDAQPGREEPAAERGHAAAPTRAAARTVRPSGPPVVVHRPTPRVTPGPRTPDRDYTRVTPAVASALSSPTRTAPPPPPPDEPKQRRPLVPIFLAGLVAVAVGAIIVMALIYALSEDDEPSAQVGPTPSSSAGQAPAPENTAPSTPSPTGGVSVAPVGGGASVPGLVAAASVVAGDSLEVTESVTWPDGGPIEIRLQLPDFSAISGLPAGLSPTIRDLQVSVDGNPVEPIPGIAAGSWVVRPLDVGVPQEMELRYLVDGALLRSTPSQPGRALAVVAPLSAAMLGELPVEIRLAGNGVLNIACAGAPDATSALCARQDGDTWIATPPDGSPAVVVAQLDLAPPA